MITFELSQQLKESGFPQKIEQGDYAYCNHKDELGNQCSELHLIHEDNDEGGLCGNNYQHRFDEVEEWIKVPALSELIKECGDGRFQLQNLKGGWYAANNGYSGEIAFGKTPEEAVANLWLELNKK